MTTHTLNLRSIVYFVVLFFSLAAVQVPAHAALIGTDSLVSRGAATAAGRPRGTAAPG